MNKSKGESTVSLKVSRRMYESLVRVGRKEGRSTPKEAEFLMEVLLALAQSECRYRILPRRLDTEPVTHKLVFRLRAESREYLEELAGSAGLSIGEQTRQLIQAGIEFSDLLNKPGRILKTGDFKMLALYELKTRSSRIH